MTTYTPYHDQPKKFETINSANNDYSEELLSVVRTYTKVANPSEAKILEIYEEGLTFSIVSQGSEEPEGVFVPFPIKGTLDEQLLYLLFSSLVKEGKDFGNRKKRFFEVVKSEKIADRFLRITIRALAPLPEEWMALAFHFQLTSVKRKPDVGVVEMKSGKFAQFMNRIFLFVMKHLSTKTRSGILKNMGNSGRYYTIRHAWKDEKDDLTFATFDVFIHGQSAGETWAKSLVEGDIIHGMNETPAKFDHLNSQAPLLIVDETGYPGVAGILEHWNYDVTPTVITVSSDASSTESYFSSVKSPEGTHFIHLSIPYEEQSKRIKEVIDGLEEVDSVWGALEVDTARDVRFYLKNERGLKGKMNRIKGYWQQETTESKNE